MCGFCGILKLKKNTEVLSSLIERMSVTLTHRGPDDAGIYVKGQIGLGHRRLSIIDIAGGHQPMKSHTHGTSQVIVYNGEIYNHLTLRKELENLVRAGAGSALLPTRGYEVLVVKDRDPWGRFDHRRHSARPGPPSRAM